MVTLFAAVIEKMFNVSLTETEEEKERLSCLSKEELIEQYLKAKVRPAPAKHVYCAALTDLTGEQKLAELFRLE